MRKQFASLFAPLTNKTGVVSTRWSIPILFATVTRANLKFGVAMSLYAF